MRGFASRFFVDLHANPPADVVLLALHGAMIATECDDCEGDLLEAIRSAVGTNSISGAILDPHCHLTPAMLRAADVCRFAAACQANGTMLVVDGIQSLGAVPVSLDKVGVFCSSTFKWLLGGYGLSALVVSEEALSKLRPAYRGHANLAPVHALQYSHTNFPGIYALEAALDYVEAVGWQTVWARVSMYPGIRGIAGGLVACRTIGTERLERGLGC